MKWNPKDIIAILGLSIVGFVLIMASLRPYITNGQVSESNAQLIASILGYILGFITGYMKTE